MDAFLTQVLAELKAARGIDLSGYRESTLQRRVAAWVAKTCPGDGDAYLRRLKDDPGEWDRLIEAITIKVSSFFRNPMMYEALARDVLPELIEGKQGGKAREIRVWSAGCATGEEPYSVAILLDQALGDQRSDWSCLIFATDLDRAALEQAEAGRYTRKQLETTKLGLVDRYFTPDGDGYQLRPSIRNLVQLSWGDLVSPDHAIPADSLFGSFDLVLCRNVLIYFAPDAQAAICEQLNRSLAPGGYLVLGAAETVSRELSGTLQAVDRKNQIYRKPPQRRSGPHR